MTALDTTAEREKGAVAFSSVLAAVLLAVMKLVIGLLTHSLGILAEAAHSGLDLVAALVTFVAVRVSGRPPDREHPYGHGKVENFSALIETLLLLATCAWIIYEAADRLFFKSVHVDSSIWSFVVMGTSIVVNITRSRALMRVAKKHGSQALEADALHFTTDVWSSWVVIAGLIAVAIAQWLHTHSPVQADWLYRADSVAALGVSGIVIYVSIQLGRRTIAALLDTAPKEMTLQVEEVVTRVPGVLGVSQIRVRPSGPATFVDMTLAVARSASFEEAHSIARGAEEAVRQLFPRTDVTTRISPVVQDEDSLVEEVRSAAARRGVSVHGIRAHEIKGRVRLEMHVEVPDDLTLAQAHGRVREFEKTLYNEMANVEEVVTHFEPMGDTEVHHEVVHTASEEVVQAVNDLPNQVPGVSNCHKISVHREGEDLLISFHCSMDPNLSIRDAHKVTSHMESLLRARLPDLVRAVIHLEPAQAHNQ